MEEISQPGERVVLYQKVVSDPAFNACRYTVYAENCDELFLGVSRLVGEHKGRIAWSNSYNGYGDGGIKAVLAKLDVEDQAVARVLANGWERMYVFEFTVFGLIQFNVLSLK